MLDAFLNAVLPVFGVLALGYYVGRRGIFDGAMAVAINRFVILVALPLLLFRLLATAPFDDFDWTLLLAYLLPELLVYAGGFLVARRLFHCGLAESVLLGLAAAFVNHVLLVLPIATLLYGERAALPVAAIGSVDTVLVFGGTVLLLDALGQQGASMTRLLMRFARTPVIFAIFAGLAIGLAGIPLPKGLDTFANFVGLCAPPSALFALGIILSQQATSGGNRLPLSISVLKLVVHPLLAWFIITLGFAVSPEWILPAMLVAAGPSGTMAFVLGLQYQVPITNIARTILYTSAGSLATLTLVAAMA